LLVIGEWLVLFGMILKKTRMVTVFNGLHTHTHINKELPYYFCN